jgi:phage gpG-like protein
MVAIELDDRDAQRVLTALGAIQMQPVLRRVAEVGAQLTRERFRSETDPFGAAWLPLSPVTLGLRARRGSASVGKLFDSGQLFGSIRSEADEDEARVIVGGPGMYARVQQQGNPDNRMFGGALAPIPARPFIPEGSDLPGDYIPALLRPLEVAIERALEATA